MLETENIELEVKDLERKILYNNVVKNNPPLVSMNVPTLNSERTIERCLKSVREQTYPNIEIIIVDNYSKDKTKEIAKRYKTTFLVRGPERSVQRNYGAQFSSGEYLLFIDSDMELEPKLIEEGVRLLETKCDPLIIPEVTVGSTYWAKVRAFGRSLYVGSRMFEATRFVKRKVFVALGGYDENLTGPEDYDFQARLEKAGYKIGYIRSRILYHEDDLSFKGYLQKRAYYARSFKRYALKHPERAKKQLGLVRVTVYVGAMLENPLLGLGSVVLKGLEYLTAKAVILSLRR